MSKKHYRPLMSRRVFLAATASAVGASTFPLRGLTANSANTSPEPGPAKYLRLNVADSRAAGALASYKRAIRAMLALPSSDPRNWYRIAFVHALDCPHGNWWFLPWHRAYLGWFEQICRQLSGDSSFALPYWDWTANWRPDLPSRVPAVMFDDVLVPTHPAYLGNAEDFKLRFMESVTKASYWKRVYKDDGSFDEDTQYGHLLQRGVRLPADLWFDIFEDPRGPLFFDLEHARGVKEAKPDLDGKTTKAVSPTTLLDALAPRDFITFSSPKIPFHGVVAGFSVLEGQPHNRIHNCVGGLFTDKDGMTTNAGGFMQAFLSPVDPLFFLHHANIDRLWDVWTRKQKARGYPILPDGYPAQPGASVPKDSDFDKWSRELFLFFVGPDGQPVPNTTAGEYVTVDRFAYAYQPGSGEEVVPPAVRVSVPGPGETARFTADAVLREESLRAGNTVSGRVKLSRELIETITGRDKPRLFAKVTLALPPLAHQDFKVIVGSPADPAEVGPSSPYYAGTLSMFGHHFICGPVTYIVPLSEALSTMRSENRLRTNSSLDVQIVPEPMMTPKGRAPRHGLAAGQVISIVVETH